MKATPPPGEPGARRPRPADPAFFDDAYYRLLEPFHTEAEARAETAAVRELLGLAQSDRILDLGCGWGRHLALLADADHFVIGLDLSVPLLQRARHTLRERDERRDRDEPADRPVAWPPLVAGDMLRLPLADRSFDVVLNLATSLGLFLDDHHARQALAGARRVLRPDGRLLLEGMHREDVEPRFAEQDAWTLDDGTEVRVRRRFDARGGVSHEVLRWDGPEGAGEKRHSLRIRTAAEVRRLVEAAGLVVTARYGDWHGEPFTSDAPRLILMARAP